jgi:hypothetical protein
MTASAPGAEPDRYELVANSEIAFPVRFGGYGATPHAMTLRFGPALYGEAPTGHLLTTVGTFRHVVHDAVVWDYAVRAFVLGDVAAIDQLAETLDLTASLFGGAGRFIAGTVDMVLDMLRSLLTPGFIVVGTLGGIIFVYVFYYILLAVLARWAFWWVVIPGLVTAGFCLGIRNARLCRLREAVLAAARAVLAEPHDNPWSQT